MRYLLMDQDVPWLEFSCVRDEFDEVTAVEDAEATVVALKTATRELRLEMPSQMMKTEVVKALRAVCPNLS